MSDSTPADALCTEVQLHCAGHGTGIGAVSDALAKREELGTPPEAAADAALRGIGLSARSGTQFTVYDACRLAEQLVSGTCYGTLCRMRIAELERGIPNPHPLSRKPVV